MPSFKGDKRLHQQETPIQIFSGFNIITRLKYFGVAMRSEIQAFIDKNMTSDFIMAKTKEEIAEKIVTAWTIESVDGA